MELSALTILGIVIILIAAITFIGAKAFSGYNDYEGNDAFKYGSSPF